MLVVHPHLPRDLVQRAAAARRDVQAELIEGLGDVIHAEPVHRDFGHRVVVVVDRPLPQLGDQRIDRGVQGLLGRQEFGGDADLRPDRRRVPPEVVERLQHIVTRVGALGDGLEPQALEFGYHRAVVGDDPEIALAISGFPWRAGIPVAVHAPGRSAVVAEPFDLDRQEQCFGAADRIVADQHVVVHGGERGDTRIEQAGMEGMARRLVQRRLRRLQFRQRSAGSVPEFDGRHEGRAEGQTVAAQFAVEVHRIDIRGAFGPDLRERFGQSRRGRTATQRAQRMQGPVLVAVLTAVHGIVQRLGQHHLHRRSRAVVENKEGAAEFDVLQRIRTGAERVLGTAEHHIQVSRRGKDDGALHPVIVEPWESDRIERQLPDILTRFVGDGDARLVSDEGVAEGREAVVARGRGFQPIAFALPGVERQRYACGVAFEYSVPVRVETMHIQCPE